MTNARITIEFNAKKLWSRKESRKIRPRGLKVLFLQLALPYDNVDKEAPPKISNTPNLSQSTRLEKTKDRAAHPLTYLRKSKSWIKVANNGKRVRGRIRLVLRYVYVVPSKINKTWLQLKFINFGQSSVNGNAFLQEAPRISKPVRNNAFVLAIK